MWTDLAAQLWPALPLFFFAGACFVVAGTIWWVAIRRHNALVDTPTIPVVVHRDYPLAVDTHPRHLRDDNDTCVIGRVPPYLPALADPPPDDDDYVHDEIIIGPKLRQETGPSVEDLDRLAARLRTTPDLGPVCPFCGGPWHAQCPSAPKSAPECPLTTDEIRIPTTGDTPEFEAQRRGDTCELSAKLAKARDAA